MSKVLHFFIERAQRARTEKANKNPHLSLALPIDKETIFVDFKQTIQLDFSVILLLRPTIEDAAGAECFRHLDLPVELEPFRHLRVVLPTSGKVSLDTASSGSVNKDQRRVVKSISIGHLSCAGRHQMYRIEYLLYVRDFEIDIYTSHSSY